MTTKVVISITIVCALSSALVVGFALGNVVGRLRGHEQQQQKQEEEEQENKRDTEEKEEEEVEQGNKKTRVSSRGASPNARLNRCSSNNAENKLAVSMADTLEVRRNNSRPSPGEQQSTANSSKQQQTSRRTRKRNKKLTPKDQALDAFTNVAGSCVPCVGAGGYQSLLLLPRTAFMLAGRFLPYDDCRDSLVTLGQARTATVGADQLRILYVSCPWASADHTQGDWTAEDYETTRTFLKRNPNLGYIYVGHSCVSSTSNGSLMATQLRHVPLILLRADMLFVLPPKAERDEEDSPPLTSGQPRWTTQLRYSDFRSYLRGSWTRMELALAAVGQAKVFVAFRATPFPESVFELKPGRGSVQEVALGAVGGLRAAAAKALTPVVVTAAIGDDGVVDKDSSAVVVVVQGQDEAVGEKEEGEEEKEEKHVAAIVQEACKNWLSSDLNLLASLEQARAVVTAVEKSSDPDILQSLRSMRPMPPGSAEVARESLGEERVEGAKELALSLLLFTVFCSQPKERATYTDRFLEDAGNMEIVYKPCAVVRSPYRERFGTPRQPQVTASVLHGGAQDGQIVFMKGHGYEEALQDLSGFDMIWVISHMHLNKGWNRKVRPPRLPEQRKGLFSTRSPHRPNPLALSSLRVDRVDAAKGVIYVHGLDLLDGTPVLDIKPYIGYCDSFPNVKAGWLDALGSDHAEQGDFLPKFSVGAALVHTAATATSVDKAQDSCRPGEAVSGLLSKGLRGVPRI